ncbi:MAG: CBS domain-containing protein [Thiohalomonadales bacterium]
MTELYKALPHYTISSHAKVNRRNQSRHVDVALSDPAAYVMTDFKDAAPFCIQPAETIDAANAKMIACGVRLLFVTGSNGDLLGLVTSTDILGEKPVQFITKNGGKRDDILVQDIMSMKEKLDVLYLDSVETSKVGNIVQTMKEIKRQHMLVVERVDDGGQETLCGMFSTTQIGRQLNINIEHSGLAGSFAAIEKTLLTA